MSDDNILKGISFSAAQQTIKSEMHKKSWWAHVNNNIQERLEWIIDNIDLIGSLFKRTYITLFAWESRRRSILGEQSGRSHLMEQAFASIVGTELTEEGYQCGVLPTRAVLNLYDFISPSDADVQACMFLCSNIEILESLHLIEECDPLNAMPKQNIFDKLTPSQSKQSGGKTKKNKKKKNNNSNEATWEYDI